MVRSHIQPNKQGNKNGGGTGGGSWTMHLGSEMSISGEGVYNLFSYAICIPKSGRHDGIPSSLDL